MRKSLIGLGAAATALAVAMAHSDTVLDVRVHSEFLWEPAAADAPARSWAQGLLLGEDFDHRICLKLTGHPEDGQSVRIVVHDGAGEPVATDEYHHPGGPQTRVRCRSAQTHHVDATPGIWTYRSTLGGAHEHVARIEVARSLDEAGFHANPLRPYIVGRTNYSEDIAEYYTGEVVFDMTIDEAGKVIDSRIVSPDAVPDVLATRIHAAASLYRFPPDADRRHRPLTVRQSLELSNETAHH